MQEEYMKGLEIAERFYMQYGAPMIHERFPQLEGVVAVGLAGSGSECMGYDDQISRDHDFEPGFCIFLPDESVVDATTAFALERAYAGLPREFCGVSAGDRAPVGGRRRGVIRISDFLLDKTGTPDGELTWRDWFFVPEQSLAEASGGKIFRDDSGYFTAIRQKLAYLPEDIRLKKLAGELLLMGQSGQYNYGRCIARGERAAAQLAVGEFVKSALHAVFLLNKKYLPYYKWSFRALSELTELSELYVPLEYLISSGNGAGETAKKSAAIEQVCGAVVDLARRQGLTDYGGDEAEGHAYSVNDRIRDGEIRNLHVLYGV